MYTKKYIESSYRKKENISSASSSAGFGPKKKATASLEQKLKSSTIDSKNALIKSENVSGSKNQNSATLRHLRMKKNAHKMYADFMGSSGLPIGEEQKYSDSEKLKKKQKYQVYKMGLNPELKSKVSYHKKSESMTQAKMKQLINKKDISFQNILETHQNTPYSNKQIMDSSLKVSHTHHNSVALSSPQHNNIVSSSTGSTRELKTVSNRIPQSKNSKEVTLFLESNANNKKGK